MRTCGPGLPWRVVIAWAAAAIAPACGDGDAAPAGAANNQPASHYAVFRHDDGAPFSRYDAGAAASLGDGTALLELGAGLHARIAPGDVSAPALVATARAGVLLFCAAGPAAPVLRFVAVPTEGTLSSKPVYEAAELAGQRFEAAAACALDPVGPMAVDAGGNLFHGDGAQAALQLTAAELSSRLHGIWAPGSRYSAFRMQGNAAPLFLIVERRGADEVDRRSAAMTLWLSR